MGKQAVLIGFAVTFACAHQALAQNRGDALLSYRLAARFQPERRGDGAPTLHFTHTFTNRSKETAYISFQGSPLYFRSIAPATSFKIVRGKTHPSTYSGMPSPPSRQQILVVAPGKSASYRTWRWVDALEVDYDKPKRWSLYLFRKPGKVRIRPCYSTWAVFVEAHRSLLPSGAKLWQGEVCAPAVEVDVKALASSGPAEG